MPIQIVSPVKIMKFNAEWWNNKDKRNTQEKIYEDIDYEFPTNYLTSYTYDEINRPEVAELNKYCISFDGQISTVSGVDTSRLSRNNDYAEYVFQREYLTFVLPIYELENFAKYFKPEKIF